MNFSFHYCCVRVLAEKAGFAPEEAQIIAHASQYTDDATEWQPLRVNNPPPLPGLRIDPQGRVDPICTAHYSPKEAILPNLEMQKKVYVPFHFLPPKTKEMAAREGIFSYLVTADAPFARALLDFARQRGDDARELQLIGLGIALHTFADTWAHQDFSGRNCQPDNDIDQLETRRSDGKWKIVTNPTGNLAPLGHLQAQTYPDRCEVEWRYTRQDDPTVYERRNSGIFLAAAERVYEELQKTPRAGTAADWAPLSARIFAVFSRQLPTGDAIVNALDAMLEKIGLATLARKYQKRRLQQWAEAFPEVNFAYDKTEWRRRALAGRHHRWDNFEARDYQTLEYDYTGDPLFFHFHVAAKRQRDFVHDNIYLNLR